MKAYLFSILSAFVIVSGCDTQAPANRDKSQSSDSSSKSNTGELKPVLQELVLSGKVDNEDFYGGKVKVVFLESTGPREIQANISAEDGSFSLTDTATAPFTVIFQKEGKSGSDHETILYFSESSDGGDRLRFSPIADIRSIAPLAQSAVGGNDLGAVSLPDDGFASAENGISLATEAAITAAVAAAGERLGFVPTNITMVKVDGKIEIAVDFSLPVQEDTVADFGGIPGLPAGNLSLTGTNQFSFSVQSSANLDSLSLDFGEVASTTGETAASLPSLDTSISTPSSAPSAGTSDSSTSTGGGNSGISPLVTFAKSLGSNAEDNLATTIAVSSTGDIYVAVQFQGTVDADIGSGVNEFTTAGAEKDFYIAKYNSSGSLYWAYQFGGTGNEYPYDIALDAAETNLYVVGRFAANFDANPGAATNTLTSNGSFDGFIIKLSTDDATFGWAGSFGDINDDEAIGVTVDSAGKVLMTGYFHEDGTPVEFDFVVGGTTLSSTDAEDVFVSKMEPDDGDLIWVKSFSDAGTDAASGRAIATDSANGVYTVGNFAGTHDFDPSGSTVNLVSAGSTDVFVSKLDSAGDFVWAFSLSSSDGNEADKVVVDADKNVYVAGYFKGTVDFDPSGSTTNLVSDTGTVDAYVMKLDGTVADPTAASGLVFAKAMGSSTGEEKARGLAVDEASGRVYVCGQFSGTTDFNPAGVAQELTSAGDLDIFVASFSSTGDLEISRGMGGTAEERCHGLALDSDGNIHFAGLYESASTDFDPGADEFNLAGFDNTTFDACLVKLDFLGQL